MMKRLSFTRTPPLSLLSVLLSLAAGSLASGCGHPQPAQPPPNPPAPSAHPGEPAISTPAPAAIQIVSPAGTPRPPFRNHFSEADEAFLDEVQRAAFLYFWQASHPDTGFIPDRTAKPDVTSVAGVGFQLSALPIGVERGWVSLSEARDRALLILTSLENRPEIRKAGFYQHFIHSQTGGLHTDTLEHVVSTIDSALLFSGMLTAGSYFGGEVRRAADAAFERADFRFFLSGPEEPEAWKRGFVSLGWKPDSLEDAAGEGSVLPYYWIDSGCEHRLVAFLGACAPREKHRLTAAHYYSLRRSLGTDEAAGPMVWFPYSGALFVNQFSHCWVNYAAMGQDSPAAHGFEPARRASVDWWENSRRHTLMHRRKAIELASEFPTFGPNAWGLSASDCPRGYCVPGLFPETLPMPGAKPHFDFAPDRPRDNPGDGTIAPYAAGTSIMFEPDLALAALRHSRSLTDSAGEPLLWRDPAQGGYGFLDAYNLGADWVAEDYVAIDQGPLLLAIENARTGLIWRLFHQHPWVAEGTARLGLTPPPTLPEAP
jgi:hypothetical protein